MKKVLHIIDSGGLYGAEIMLLNLMEEQIKMGVIPILASIGKLKIPEKAIESEAIKRGVAVQKFRMRAGPNFLGAMHILNYAKSKNVELLHSHGYKSNILFGFIPKCIRKLPLVSTIHGWTNTSGFNRMKIYEWLDSISLRFIDVVILVNKEMLNHKKIAGRRNINIKIINNGIVLSEQTMTLSEKIEFDNIIIFCQSGYTIGAIGRLSNEKGFDRLLEALKIIQNSINDVRLVIIGEGDQRIALEHKVIALDLKQNVLLPGYIKNARILIPYFDLFVLPSLTEGLPITVLEAMHAGVPIVATKVGGLPDVLDHGKYGCLVDRSTGVELANGILKIMKSPDKGKFMTEAAKLHVIEQYSSSNMAKKYVEIYQSIYD